MKNKPVSPERIMQLVTGHWSLKALSVAVDLSIFTSLKSKEFTAKQLSNLLGIPLRSLERLLNANSALGFLVKSGDKYRNTEIADTYLIGGLPTYLGDFIKLAGEYGFAKWTRFKECIVNDTPIEDLDDDFRHSEDRMQYFIRAMHNNAKGSAKFLTTLPIIEGHNHLLDLGGGSGVYSIALTEKYPDLHATLVDFPPVCKVAREFVKESRSSNRIEIIEGDLLTDNLSIKGDFILLSQVLHGMSKQQCRNLINKCYKWTLPDGIIIVHEFILDDNKVSPLYPALFALNMLITTPEGNSYTKGELTDWLKEGGYNEISYHPTPGPSTFIIGHKK